MIVQGALALQPSLQFLAHSGFRGLPGSHKVLVPRGTPYNAAHVGWDRSDAMKLSV